MRDESGTKQSSSLRDGNVIPHPSSLILCLRDADELSRAAADEFLRLAEEAVQAKGEFRVALSGGSTPKRLYELLASDDAAYRMRLPWSEIRFFFGDERHVPPDHADSNFRMANEAMFAKSPVPGENVHRVKAEMPDAHEAADEYEQTMRRVFRLKDSELPRFDLILLGMGADGHTASLFPGSPALDERERFFVANPVAKFNTDRLTMTLPVINNAAVCLFLVAGSDKTETLRRVLDAGAQDATFPSQLVHPTNGELVWFVDEAAADSRSEMT